MKTNVRALPSAAGDDYLLSGSGLMQLAFMEIRELCYRKDHPESLLCLLGGILHVGAWIPCLRPECPTPAAAW